MSTPNPDRPLGLSELCLGNGWHAGLSVRADGTTWPWLLAPGEEGGKPCDPFPAHELEGPLPWRYRIRLAPPLVCGARTKTGTLCRAWTSGGRCHWHQNQGAQP